MSIQYKFFTIPVNDADTSESEMNRFMRSQRTLAVHREFVSNAENSFWAIAVEYLSNGGVAAENANKDKKRARIDYKEILSPEDFVQFVKLREWRKVVAEKEAVSVYTIFTNEQLAEIVRKKVSIKAALNELVGWVKRVQSMKINILHHMIVWKNNCANRRNSNPTFPERTAYCAMQC